jgi:restriction system protein
MLIPTYEDAMLPLLRLAADGNEHSLSDTIEQLARQFDLGEKELAELLQR